MKFDPTKFRLPGFFRRLLQNRQMKYVLLAVAFSALIFGAYYRFSAGLRRTFETV